MLASILTLIRALRLLRSIRILYMPPVYAVISFLSYRFFRSYTYYSLVEVAYEVCLFFKVHFSDVKIDCISGCYYQRIPVCITMVIFFNALINSPGYLLGAVSY